MAKLPAALRPSKASFKRETASLTRDSRREVGKAEKKMTSTRRAETVPTHHYNPQRPDVPASIDSLSHELGSECVSERANEQTNK